MLAFQTTVLLALAVLLSTAISPMALGVVAVGLFGTTWAGGAGESLSKHSVERVGCWRVTNLKRLSLVVEDFSS